MTRPQQLAYNAGVADLAAIAAAAADALRARITEAPTRFAFAISALEGIVEAASDLMQPALPDGIVPAGGDPPKPGSSQGAKDAALPAVE